jgi:hypothetical protein
LAVAAVSARSVVQASWAKNHRGEHPVSTLSAKEAPRTLEPHWVPRATPCITKDTFQTIETIDDVDYVTMAWTERRDTPPDADQLNHVNPKNQSTH